jgi:hypothetical protein
MKYRLTILTRRSLHQSGIDVSLCAESDDLYFLDEIQKLAREKLTDRRIARVHFQELVDGEWRHLRKVRST